MTKPRWPGLCGGQIDVGIDDWGVNNESINLPSMRP